MRKRTYCWACALTAALLATLATGDGFAQDSTAFPMDLRPCMSSGEAAEALGTKLEERFEDVYGAEGKWGDLKVALTLIFSDDKLGTVQARGFGKADYDAMVTMLGKAHGEGTEDGTKKRWSDKDLAVELSMQDDVANSQWLYSGGCPDPEPAQESAEPAKDEADAAGDEVDEEKPKERKKFDPRSLYDDEEEEEEDDRRRRR